jgi:hypothetical protein
VHRLQAFVRPGAAQLGANEVREPLDQLQQDQRVLVHGASFGFGCGN